MSSKSSRDRKRRALKARAANPEVVDATVVPPHAPAKGDLIQYREIRSGPIPSARELQQYDEIHPGLANRIVKMAEDQSAHRRAIEKTVVDGNVAAQEKGQGRAFILAILFMIFAGVLVYNGLTAAGVAVIIAEIASLVGAFIWGRKKQAAERVAKSK